MDNKVIENEKEENEDNQHRNTNYNKKYRKRSNNNSKKSENANSIRTTEDRIYERLTKLQGHTFDLPPLDLHGKKFANRNRLFVGNIHQMSEEEIKKLFEPHGKIKDVFVNLEKNFAFVSFDYYENAEKAMNEIDGTFVNGRVIKVRFAVNYAVLKIKNLTPHVSNELLHHAFSIFGEIERCFVNTDSNGKSIGEGTIYFARKSAAQLAYKYCTESCFCITSSPRPVVVEYSEFNDDGSGITEKSLIKDNDYELARMMGPRFAKPGNFEYEYGTRWKALYETYSQKLQYLKQQLQIEAEKLEAQMTFAKYEQETEMLREQLRRREMDAERQRREWKERERLAETMFFQNNKENCLYPNNTVDYQNQVQFPLPNGSNFLCNGKQTTVDNPSTDLTEDEIKNFSTASCSTLDEMRNNNGSNIPYAHDEYVLNVTDYDRNRDNNHWDKESTFNDNIYMNKRYRY